MLKGAAETFRVLAQKLVAAYATMVSPSWKLYVTANDGKMNNLGKVANPIINQVTPRGKCFKKSGISGTEIACLMNTNVRVGVRKL